MEDLEDKSEPFNTIQIHSETKSDDKLDFNSKFNPFFWDKQAINVINADKSISSIINQNFSVDLREPRFRNVFERIKRIFDNEGGYLNFIKKVDNSIVKEAYILMRKYQHFFLELKLNEIQIFNFSKSSDCLLSKFESYYESDTNSSTGNIFELNLLVLPKFKKNEINFEIPENYLDIIILVNKESKVEIKNLKDKININEYSILNKILSKLFQEYLKNFRDNPLTACNKFLTYLENYFPEVHKTAIEKTLEIQNSESKDIWTQEEQEKLEEALKIYSSEKIAKEKFRKIADYIKTKSLNECINRYKKIAALTKTKVEGTKVESKPTNNSKTILTSNKINSPVRETEIKTNPNKIKKNVVDHTEDKQESVIPVFPEKKELNTEDLVDAIVNQFNNLYGTVEKHEEELGDNENAGYLYKELSESQSSNSEGESSTEDKMYLKNEEKNPNRNKKTDYISKQNKFLISSIFKMGERHQLNLSALIMTQVALAEIYEPKLFLKCAKCKQIGFESQFMKFNKNVNIFYMGALCPKCNNEMHVIFKSNLLHSNNLTSAGVIFSLGVVIIDFLQCGYTFNCLECTDTWKKVRLRIGGIPKSESKCRTCPRDLGFYIYSGSIIPGYGGDLSFIDELQINNFQKFNLSIDDEDSSNYVKKYDKVIQQGNPLPEKGSCRHYKKSFRWFRFGCCSKTFPCDECHDEVSTHESEYAKTILCGHCAFEQNSLSKICCKCGKSFFLEEGGTGFWEGGKGCRDKTLMSSKDNHKFKGSSLKTISRKKKNESTKK